MTVPRDVTQQIVHELMNLTRRFRVKAEQIHPALSYASYALLNQMAAADGVRVGDLIERTGLNKSTLSRQLAALQRAGLVIRELHPDDSRVQVVRPSSRGHELLVEADIQMSRDIHSRTQGWTPEEVATFHTLLARYNAAADFGERSSSSG